MAGGQGTRLGYVAPKGTFKIGGGVDKSLFEALSDTIKEAREELNTEMNKEILFDLSMILGADIIKNSMKATMEVRTAKTLDVFSKPVVEVAPTQTVEKPKGISAMEKLKAKRISK